MEHNIKYGILTVYDLSASAQKFQVVMKLEPCIILKLILYLSDSEPQYS